MPIFIGIRDGDLVIFFPATKAKKYKIPLNLIYEKYNHFIKSKFKDV